jgi:hypothetical protein
MKFNNVNAPPVFFGYLNKNMKLERLADNEDGLHNAVPDVCG